MVEMILVLPMLLFVMFAIVELSRAWFTVQLTSTAVREGARAGAVAASNNVVTEGEARLDAILAQAGVNVASRTVTLNTVGAGPDQEVIATANVRFQTLFPNLLPQLNTINITQTARMRFECSGCP